MQPTLTTLLTRTFILTSLAALAPAAQQFPKVPVEAAIRAEFERQSIPGAVVGIVLDDQIVFQLVLGHSDLGEKTVMRADTLFQIGSVTKPMTATLLGALQETDRLLFDDTVARFIPEEVALPEAIGNLTLRQLASHSSGLPRVAVNRVDIPNTPSVPEPYSIRQLYTGLETTELVFEPGTVADYSNLGFGILGHIVERASGKSYGKFLTETLCEPLGMTSTFVHPNEEQRQRLAKHYWVRDNPPVTREPWKFGEIVGHGGVTSNMPDLAKFVALQWRGLEDGPLNSAMLAALREPTAKMSGGTKVCLGWFISEVPGARVIRHGGEVDGHSSSLAYIPSLKIGFVALANRGGDAAPSLAKAALQAWWRSK